MPYIHIHDKKLYFREYGKGEPIVFLNGMMMSTSSWIPFADTVSKGYRMITVDLLDQGRSDDCEEGYTVDTQASYLNSFLDKLGLDRVHLLGMSYGGKVALTFAVKYPSKVKSLILSNTDSLTPNIMKEIGKGWAHAVSTLDGEVFSSIVFPYMYSYNFYENNHEFIEYNKKALFKALNERWRDRFLRHLHSALDYDLSLEINKIKVPTLIISSELDTLTLTQYQEYIHNQIENSQCVIIKGAGHAVIFEKPKEYISLVMKFLDNINNQKQPHIP